MHRSDRHRPSPRVLDARAIDNFPCHSPQRLTSALNTQHFVFRHHEVVTSNSQGSVVPREPEKRRHPGQHPTPLFTVSRCTGLCRHDKCHRRRISSRRVTACLTNQHQFIVAKVVAAARVSAVAALFCAACSLPRRQICRYGSTAKDARMAASRNNAKGVEDCFLGRYRGRPGIRHRNDHRRCALSGLAQCRCLVDARISQTTSGNRRIDSVEQIVDRFDSRRM